MVQGGLTADNYYTATGYAATTGGLPKEVVDSTL
jgi:hypothetical protein